MEQDITDKNSDIQKTRKALAVLGLLVGLVVILVIAIFAFDKIVNFIRGKTQYTINTNIPKQDPKPKNIECERFYSLEQAIKNIDIACGLNLSGKQLSTLPKDVLLLKRLYQIILDNNKFTTIPQELSTLPNLYEIDMSNNNISEVPTYIIEFKPLQRLDIQNNKLTTLPDMSELKNLNYLDISGNNISQAEYQKIKAMFVGRPQPVEIIY